MPALCSCQQITFHLQKPLLLHFDIFCKLLDCHEGRKGTHGQSDTRGFWACFFFFFCFFVFFRFASFTRTLAHLHTHSHKHKHKHTHTHTPIHPFLHRANCCCAFQTRFRDAKVLVGGDQGPMHDLIVMCKADFFVGNCVSSFTSFVARYRQHTTKQHTLLPSGFFGIQQQQNQQQERHTEL